MKSNKHKVITLQEYGATVSFSSVAVGLDLKTMEFSKLLLKALNRLKTGSAANYIESDGQAFRIVGIAGILQLTKNIRLEIIPKFLGEEYPEWREDFLRVTLLTKYGTILPAYRSLSAMHTSLDIYEILAEMWTKMFEEQQRDFIRSYVRSQWDDYLIDGEIDEESLIIPQENGFSQSGLKLTGNNYFNHTLLKCARYLYSKVTNPHRALRLEKAITRLNTIAPFQKREQKPVALRRQNSWLPLITLSENILQNGTVKFATSGIEVLPSYVVRTHWAWERLVFLALKKGFKGHHISKVSYQLGNRISPFSAQHVLAIPDVTIKLGNLTLIVDAKYKTVIGKGSTLRNKALISNADIHEGLSYLGTTGSKQLVLLYPSTEIGSDRSGIQKVEEFEDLAGNKIIALTVSVCGISKPNGFNAISSKLYLALRDYMTKNSKISI